MERETISETGKAWEHRNREGFFIYCQGKGIDIGPGNYPPVVETADSWDYCLGHGDAQLMQGVPDDTYDYVYTSALLEHMTNPTVAIANWWRILKTGGYLILFVPQAYLFERKQLLEFPIDLSERHKFWILPDRSRPPHIFGLLDIVNAALGDAPREFKYMKLCDAGWFPTTYPEVANPPGEYMIELVIQKGQRGGDL